MILLNLEVKLDKASNNNRFGSVVCKATICWAFGLALYVCRGGGSLAGSR